MKRIFFLSIFFPLISIQSQTINFELFGLPLDSFYNGSDFSGGVEEGPFMFINRYDSSFGGFWDGFAISTMRDDSTGGYLNQYSSITGGAHSEISYAVGFEPYSDFFGIEANVWGDASLRWNSIYVTNSTYAYLSMKEGDGFAKKFGGPSGTDPDYFTLRMYRTNDSIRTDSIDFQLADFTSVSSSEDYIVNDWTMVDLSLFDPCFESYVSLEFKLFSSDTNSFGIKTPAYFCFDDLSYSVIGGLDGFNQSETLKVKNLGNSISVITDSDALIHFYAYDGSLIRSDRLVKGENNILLDSKTRGHFIVRVSNQLESAAFKLYFQ
jgi:hypothetical protein